METSYNRRVLGGRDINTFYYETPIGTVGITEEEGCIIGFSVLEENTAYLNNDKNESDLLKEASNQLIEYLSGKRMRFSLPLNPQGTEFQKRVWNKLIEIPYGETRSYGEIATEIGNPKACRAVGMANNRNPIMIVIPCHRVIGSNGSLVGYGGGLPLKQRLLELEQR